MESTIKSDTFEKVNGHRQHSVEDVHIIILSSVLPVYVFIIVVIVIRRVLIRRRVRTIGRNSPVFIISQPAYELRYHQQKSIPDIDRVTKIVQKSPSKRQKSKDEILNGRSKNGNKQNISPITVFPREPVYRNQQTPSYIVPFTELPPHFDFSLANIEVYSDFVVIKDLNILQRYWCNSHACRNPYITA
ncbi:uncharacterized protein LOC130444959 [Diorhabda sublineata]|uniref:uncharacterized protein LOC130444959 n=1 Tax=Diorhabda sublineata TaxID=1163346 RepID=UPI0024E0BE49|nr:uncharacterized protein LOC130444959 [Diorhabda sublineata]